MGSSSRSSSSGGGSQSRPMIYDAKLLQLRKKKKRKEKEQLQRAANGVAGQARPAANSPKPAVYRNNNNKCPMQFEF